MKAFLIYLSLLFMSMGNLYTNNLKSREFDKETPQIFCPERAKMFLAAAAEIPEGRADLHSTKQVSEERTGPGDRKSQTKPTLAKTDSSGCLCISASYTPEFVQLEQKIVDFLKTSWCTEEKAKLILECVVGNRPNVCVEIGAFTGSSTLPLLTALQFINHGYAYIIDAWSNSEAIQGLPEEDPNAVWWASLDMQAIKNQFMQTMDQWFLTPYFQVLHMSSQEAAAELPEIDFLHLDGNFSEEGALIDSQLYLPKVVPNGHILISNVLTMIDNHPTKMKALWPLFEQCELIYEIENGNALLFRKK